MHTQRFASKPEAIAFMAKLQRDTAPLANSKLTIEEWIHHWFDNHGVAWERATLHRAGKSGNTINSAVRVLSAAIGAAVQDGLRESNPCIGLKPVPKRPVQRRPIPVAEIEAIRHELVEPRDRLVVSLLAYAGLRPGEMVETYAHLFSERQGMPGEPAEDVILQARHDSSSSSSRKKS